MRNRQAFTILLLSLILLIGSGSLGAQYQSQSLVSTLKTKVSNFFKIFQPKKAELKKTLPQCPSKPYWVAQTKRFEYKESINLSDLVYESNLCLDATVKGFETCPPPVEGAATMTFVTFMVNQVLCGAYPPEVNEEEIDYFDPTLITVPFAGGCINNQCQVFSNGVQFKRFERVFFFLRQGRPIPLTGGPDGLYLIGEAGVTNYEGQPLTSCESATGKLAFEYRISPKPKEFDSETYGTHTIAVEKRGEPRRLIEGEGYLLQEPRPMGSPISKEQFAACILSMAASRVPPETMTQQILPAGTPYQYGPLQAVAP